MSQDAVDIHFHFVNLIFMSSVICSLIYHE